MYSIIATLNFLHRLTFQKISDWANTLFSLTCYSLAMQSAFTYLFVLGWIYFHPKEYKDRSIWVCCILVVCNVFMILRAEAYNRKYGNGLTQGLPPTFQYDRYWCYFVFSFILIINLFKIENPGDFFLNLCLGCYWGFSSCIPYPRKPLRIKLPKLVHSI